jgi:hypothetical protein
MKKFDRRLTDARSYPVCRRNPVTKSRRLEMRRIGMMLLSHPDAKLLMDTLTNMFYKGSLLGETPEKTYFNLGQREVVEFLLDLKDRATKEK